MKIEPPGISINFDPSTQRLSRSDSGLLSSESTRLKRIIPSMSSFRVLSECPFLFVFFFQLYDQTLTEKMPSIVPLMIKSITATVAHTEHHKKAFVDFISCQINTLSFIVQLIRSNIECVKEFKRDISGAVVHLLQICPVSLISVRKKLLISSHYIIANPEYHRVSFLKSLSHIQEFFFFIN